jgi:hypothetical protein
MCAPPKYERALAATSFTPFEERVRALLAEHPDMLATVIAERVGWSGSISWFRGQRAPVRARASAAGSGGSAGVVAGRCRAV